MAETTDRQKWLKPSEIARRGLILDSNGNPNYRMVLRLINQGKLKAKVWTQQGEKPYFMVHIDDIHEYNSQWER